MTTTGPAPDLIILARKCHPHFKNGRPAQAVAVQNGRIMALGTRRAIRRLRGRGTKLLDLGDAVLTPGLIDAHTHFFYWALNRLLVIDVSDAPTLEAALQRLQKESQQKSVGDWIVGRGFDKNIWGRDFPAAADLDRVFPKRPVSVRSRDGHVAWLNTVALQKAGISAATPDPKGGGYLRDAHGRPTGIVLEAAIDALPNPVAQFARRTDAAALKTIDRALREAYQVAWSFGIVGAHCMDDAPSLFHFQRQHRARALGVRIVHSIPLNNLEQACALGLRSGFGDDWLRLGAVKIFADGTLGSQTAYMFDEYPGRKNYRGVPVVAGEELYEIVQRAAQNGWASWIHAIGDRAAHDAITATAAAHKWELARRRTASVPASVSSFAKLTKKFSRTSETSSSPALQRSGYSPHENHNFLRHRIEHAQCVRPADIRLMARAGIVASMQPCHLLGDIRNADKYWPRARRDAYPFRRMLQAGVTLAFGSDVPIESLDPRRSFYAAAARRGERGDPPSGWFPEQTLSMKETLHAFTAAARASGGDAPGAGTLAPGAPADLTLWKKDPLETPAEELLEIGIAGCIVAGQAYLENHSPMP